MANGGGAAAERTLRPGAGGTRGQMGTDGDTRTRLSSTLWSPRPAPTDKPITQKYEIPHVSRSEGLKS